MSERPLVTRLSRHAHAQRRSCTSDVRQPLLLCSPPCCACISSSPAALQCPDLGAVWEPSVFPTTPTFLRAASVPSAHAWRGGTAASCGRSASLHGRSPVPCRLPQTLQSTGISADHPPTLPPLALLLQGRPAVLWECPWGFLRERRGASVLLLHRPRAPRCALLLHVPRLSLMRCPACCSSSCCKPLHLCRFSRGCPAWFCSPAPAPCSHLLHPHPHLHFWCPVPLQSPAQTVGVGEGPVRAGTGHSCSARSVLAAKAGKRAGSSCRQPDAMVMGGRGLPPP